MSDSDWETTENYKNMVSRVLRLFGHKAYYVKLKLRLFVCACVREFSAPISERIKSIISVVESCNESLISKSFNEDPTNDLEWRGLFFRPRLALSYVSRWPNPEQGILSSYWSDLTYRQLSDRLQSDILRDLFGSPIRKRLIDCESSSMSNGVCWHHDKELQQVYTNLWLCPDGLKYFNHKYLNEDVIKLARAAYDNITHKQKCYSCVHGKVAVDTTDINTSPTQDKDIRIKYKRILIDCQYCRGTGLVESTRLDNVSLSILADAIEDTGCDDFSILSHLRSPEPHWKGCWAVDLFLKEDK